MHARASHLDEFVYSCSYWDIANQPGILTVLMTISSPDFRQFHGVAITRLGYPSTPLSVPATSHH